MPLTIEYAVMNPTGNITILVETPVPVPDQPRIAAILMEKEPDAEQVGFVTPGSDSDIELRMAGGEFCGNAAMSAAALFAENHFQEKAEGTGVSTLFTENRLLKKTEGAERTEKEEEPDRAGRSDGKEKPKRTVMVRVSGADRPLQVELMPLADGSAGMQGRIAMPGALSVEEIQFPEGDRLPVVNLGGISHVIMEMHGRKPDRELADVRIRTMCSFLQADALGIMFLDEKRGLLTPLVYVPAADTLYWENSCASGTTAVGIYLAGKRKTFQKDAQKDFPKGLCGDSRKDEPPFSIALRQPGGSLEISVSDQGEPFLTGRVCLQRRGICQGG